MHLPQENKDMRKLTETLIKSAVISATGMTSDI
jgi:hypothetical protein